MAEAKSTVIPDFLTAGSPRELRRLMFKNNVAHSAWFNYQIQFANGKWYAWFHVDLTRSSNVSDFAQDPKELKGQK